MLQLEDFSAALRNLGIDGKKWRTAAQKRLASGLHRITEVIPDPEARDAFIKFTEAVKRNVVDNRTTLMHKIQADNPHLVEQVKNAFSTVSDNVHVNELKSHAAHWISRNEEDLTGLKQDVAGLISDVTQSDEFQKVKVRGKALFDQVKDTEQAARLLDHGKNLLSSDRTKELLSSTAERTESLATQEINIEGRLNKVMSSNVVKKVVETGSKLLQNEQVKAAIAKSSEYLNEKGGAQASSVLQKGRSLIKRTRDSGTAQKLLSRGADLLDKHGDTLLKRLEATDVDSLVEKGKNIFSSAAERQKFLNTVKDMAMDFLIKQLPAVQIPPIEGIADRLQFGIDNLDLSSFVIKKEHVHVRIGDFKRTGNLFEAEVTNISASMRDFNWLFHQHYFPHMRGDGSAHADLGDGIIRLQFGLRRVADETVRGGYVPRLVVNNLEIDIKHLELKFFDSKMSGLINMLSRLFKDTIRRRLTETLATKTAAQLGRLVGRLNSFALRYIPMALKYFQVDMSHLPEGEPNVNVIGMDNETEYVADMSFTNGSFICLVLLMVLCVASGTLCSLWTPTQGHWDFRCIFTRNRQRHPPALWC